MSGAEVFQNIALRLLQRGHYRHHTLDKARTVLALRAKAALTPLHPRTDRPVTVEEGSLPPPLLQNRACHFGGTRLLSDAPSVRGIRPPVGQTCGLTFRASPLWDIAPSRHSMGLALLQRYSSRSRTHHRP